MPEEMSVRTCGNSYGDVDGNMKCDVCDGNTCTDWKLYKPEQGVNFEEKRLG